MNGTQNLTLYHIFYVTALEGSISKAAQTLYISQPAISKSIQRLEAALDTTLFLRNSRGVSLTESGRLLFDHIASAFDHISQAEEELLQVKNLKIGYLKIGVSTTLCKYILLPYLQRFVREYPYIQITIHCHSSNQTLQLLREKKIDIGLVGRPGSLEGLCFSSLGNIQDIFVASPSYLENLDLRSPGASKNLFQNATLMLLDKENMTRQYLDSYFSRQQLSPNHLLEVTNMELLIEFARIGLGAACVIREFVEEDIRKGSLIELPMKVPLPEREIGFITPQPSACSEAVTRFLQLIRR